jgi:hypothetical protein
MPAGNRTEGRDTAMNDEMGIQWRKSSYSTGDGGGDECVEVGWLLSTAALLRDSKSPENGHLHIPASAFAAFMTSIKAS